jgi:hypothetical protein
VLGLSALAVVACTAPAPIPTDPGDNTPSTKKPIKNQPGTTEVKEADASVDAPGVSAVCETVPPTNKCGLDPQCGCGPNETCDVTSEVTGATSCLTAGTTTLGRPCMTTSDCIAGLLCDYGACRPYCKTAGEKCTVGGTDLCVAVMDANNKPVPNKSVCTIQCDPRSPQAVCGAGNACLWYPTLYAPNKVSDCNFGGSITAYSTTHCVDSTDCVPGTACIQHPNKNIGLECEQWCRIGQAGDCPTTPANLTCKDVYGADAPMINGVKLGVCQD